MVGHDAATPETIRESVVNVNGELVPGSEASVPVLDRSVLYGDAVYDSLPVVDGKALLVDRHVDRLFDALRGVRISPGADEAAFTEEILRTATASDLTDGSIRTIVSRGAGPAGIANTDGIEGPTVLVVPQHVPGMAAAHRDLSTRRAIVASTRTVPHDTVDPRIKSCNYLPNALAERETVGTDADSAVMLDHEGYVAEVYDANVVVCDREGTIRTPPRTRSLGGITREVLLERARESGHVVAAADLTPYDLRTARDVLMTSSAHGVARVTHLDGEQVGGDGPSETVTDLVDRYWAYVTGHEYVSLEE
jgi:branched-chain amino acid aminotransferase